jgi:hypothetical protein
VVSRIKWLRKSSRSSVPGLAVISSSAFPASHQALPPGRVPHVRGLSRTWVEKDGRSPFPFSFPVSRWGPVVKALEKDRVQPMYAKVREHGAPVQGARLGEHTRDLVHNQRRTLTSVLIRSTRLERPRNFHRRFVWGAETGIDREPGFRHVRCIENSLRVQLLKQGDRGELLVCKP